MSAVENIIAMVVLMGLFIAAFVIVTGLNLRFFGETVDYSVRGFNKEKYGNDIDAVLNLTEPVSKDSYANLLADAVYYRKSYFDYNAPPDLGINDDIAFYYNDDLWPDENRLQVDKLMELTFNKLYGEKNFYLEIEPLFVKLRLYFIVDGSTSLENEVAQLKQAIPELINEFESEFDVVARVFVLAEGGLDQLNPCDDLQAYADCKYLHKEEMYTGQVGKGWLTNIWYDSWKTNSTYNTRGSTWSLQQLLSEWPYYIRDSLSFSRDYWNLSSDEFLDETDSNSNKPSFYCSWVDIDKNAFDSFKLQLDFEPGAAGVRVNKTWHNALNGVPIDVFADLNTETNWQMFCLGYRPAGNTLLSYRYIAAPSGESEDTGYFKLDELFAFMSPPKGYEFSEKLIDIELGFPGGIFYEDWATASAYAAIIAEKENPSTLTVIIPISDELSLGSEAEACEAKSGFPKVFCERCNKFNSADLTPLECPVERSSEDVNRAIGIIKPYGYSVFPVLANSCDIENPYKDSGNLVCSNFFTPYGTCGEPEGYVCGQCFGPNEMECPGLTLENPGAGVFGSIGCDKKQCRPFIEEQMQLLADETGGKMIELTGIEMLHGEISSAIKESVENYKIEAGMKKPEEQRFVYEKLVPLSNRLFANLKFWHYEHSEGD